MIFLPTTIFFCFFTWTLRKIHLVLKKNEMHVHGGSTKDHMPVHADGQVAESAPLMAMFKQDKN